MKEFKKYARTMVIFARSDKEKEELMSESEYKDLGIFDVFEIEYKSGFEKTDNQTDNELVNLYRSTLDMYDPAFPVTVVTGRRVSLGGGLILILQAVFPMILTAGAVKESSMYASKVLGM